MLSCESCGGTKFHFNEEMGIVCDACIARKIPNYFALLDQQTSKMDLVNSDEVFI